MKGTEHVIICSDNNWDLCVVSCVNLCGLVDEVIAGVEIAVKVVFNLVEITVRCPTVSIYNRYKNILNIQH